MNDVPKYATSRQVRREAKHIEKVLGIRMDSADKAMSLARAEITRVPTDLDRRMAALKELIGQQIKTLEERIGQQAALLTNAEAALGEKTSDLTTRLTELTSTAVGRKEFSTPVWTLIASVATALVIAGSLALTGRTQFGANAVPVVQQEKCQPVAQ